MSRHLVAAVLVTLSLVGGACTEDAPEVEGPDATGVLDNTAWTYVDGLDLEPAGGTQLSLRFGTDPLRQVSATGKTMGAFDGCNSIGGPYDANGSAITWDVARSTTTLVGCHNAVAAEYIEALFATEQFTVTGETLALTGEAHELRFRSTPIINKADMVETVWLLESVTRDDVVVPAVTGDGSAAFVEFSAVGLAASTGCHRYAGTWSIKQSNRLQVSNLRISGVCDEELSDQEAVIRAVLSSRSSIEDLDETELRLASADGDQLLLRRSPGDEIPPQPVNFVAASDTWRIDPLLGDAVSIHIEPADGTRTVAELLPGRLLDAVGEHVLTIDDVQWRQVSTTDGRQGWLRAERLVPVG